MQKMLRLVLILWLPLIICSSLFAQIVNEDFATSPTPILNHNQSRFGSSVAMDGDYAVVGAPGVNNGEGNAEILHFTGITWESIAKLSPSEHDSNANFGTSVSISDSIIVVGAPGNNAAYVFAKPLTGWMDMTETAKLTPADVESVNRFGYAVDIDAEDIVVGSFGQVKPGTAYVFSMPVSGWTDTTETAKLSTIGNLQKEYFGISVSISNDVIVVGCLHDGAYVYQKPVNGWSAMTETAKLGSSFGEGIGLGISVCIEGDIIGLGASTAGANQSGHVYLYEKPENGWGNMNETVKLSPSDSTNRKAFGFSVCMSNDMVIVGANEDITYRKGSAYVFEKPAGGWNNMTQSAKLTALHKESMDEFGSAVCTSNGRIMVGAYGVDGDDYQMGAVYSFEKPSAGWSDITEVQKIFPSTSYYNSYYQKYGSSVSVDGNIAVIGATQFEDKGCAYVLEYDEVSWKVLARLTSSDGIQGQLFGCSVSISGDLIVVGDYLDDEKGNASGAVYVFEKPVNGWKDMTETSKITASDAEPSDGFGYAVDVEDNLIVVGAYGNDDKGENAGAIYLFEKPATGWQDLTDHFKLIASDGQENDNLGVAVSISSDVIVAGAYHDGDNGSNSGSAYVFVKPASGWENMTQTAKLLPSDGASGDNFGCSVSISNDVVVIGANLDDDKGDNSGAAYIYKKPDGGWINTTQTIKIVPEDGAVKYNFGNCVAISDDVVIVGAYKAYSYEENGQVYLYKKNTDDWTEVAQKFVLRPVSKSYEGHFGNSLAISGELIVIGEDNRGYLYPQFVTNGGAYLYKACYLNDTESPVILCPNDQVRVINANENYYSSKGNEFDLQSVEENCKIHSISNNINYLNSLGDRTFNPGTSYIVWTVKDIAGNKSECSFYVTIEIQTGNEELQDYHILVYPNPSEELLIVDFGDFKGNALAICDMKGKLRIEKDCQSQKEYIDISSLESGLYLVRVFSVEKELSFKILKKQ